jgi:hypothetical protein
VFIEERIRKRRGERIKRGNKGRKRREEEGGGRFRLSASLFWEFLRYKKVLMNNVSFIFVHQQIVSHTWIV